jgi:excisionase family DNA binding protein
MGQTTNAIEVTLSELAELMQATAPRILRLVENRGLPTFRKHGQWRFRLDEVSAWMNRQSLAITAREPRRRSFEATQNQRA